MVAPPLSLADTYREIYRAKFREEYLAGDKRPFLVPLCFVGYHVIPTLYLAIPHKNRPWLYRARWLVLALTTIFQIKIILEVSSTNFASGYGAGLLAAWATVWNFTLLVWTRPQWDAKRVERVRNKNFKKIEGRKGGVDHNTAKYTNGQFESNGYAANGNSPVGDGERQKGDFMSNGLDLRRRANGHPANDHASVTIQEKEVVDDDEGERQQFVYEWQEYPENASFLTRLDWAFDIVSSLRLTGWNWAIPVLPAYQPPPRANGHPESSQLPLSFSGSNRSRHGYTRVLSRSQLVLERIIFNIIPNYLVLDYCAIDMTQDPYFILGPNNLPLPVHLASLDPAVLSLRRTAFAFFSLISALQMTWNFGAVSLALLAPPILGFRAHPWHLPTMTGSFSAVLDHGLSGFWGTWWHQTFRFGFSAPTNWLIQRGYLRKGSTCTVVVGALVAFLLSGFLHGAGSYSTMPMTHYWEPPLFFLLAGFGTQLQRTVSRALKQHIVKLPIWTRRAGNLGFVALWCHATSGFLFDDFSRSGLFLYEPVPISPLRYLGLGLPSDSWWRWDRDTLPHYYVGQHWWSSGWGI